MYEVVDRARREYLDTRRAGVRLAHTIPVGPFISVGVLGARQVSGGRAGLKG
jgi:hypothetical protein